MMLSELQRKRVWEEWLSAEIRAHYFADLAYRYHAQQRAITWLILVFSSGAFITLVADWLPPAWVWMRPVLTAATAALSLWMLVTQHQTHATKCSDLHFAWNKLATEYEALWEDMYSEQARGRLHALQDQTAELSKIGTDLPNRRRLMEKWEEHVVQHHQRDAAAA